MWWWCIAAGCEIVHLKMITYGIHYSVHYWSKKNAHDNSQQKKLWTDMNPSNIRVLVWYKCKNGTEAWLLLKILFQLPSMTNLCYKMRWQQYEENITRGSLLYTILFIKQVTPACSRWTDELQRLLGMWVPASSAFETKHFVNRTSFITKSFSMFVSSNVFINLAELYTKQGAHDGNWWHWG